MRVPLKCYRYNRIICRVIAKPFGYDLLYAGRKSRCVIQMVSRNLAIKSSTRVSGNGSFTVRSLVARLSIRTRIDPYESQTMIIGSTYGRALLETRTLPL